METSFTDRRGRSTRREPPTMCKQLVNLITCGCESSAPFLSFTKPNVNPRRIGDRLVWVFRYSNYLTHWATGPLEYWKNSTAWYHCVQLCGGKWIEMVTEIRNAKLWFCLLTLKMWKYVNNKCCASSGVVTDFPSEVPEFMPCFSEVRVHP